MSKVKLVLLGLGIGILIALTIRYIYVEYLWTYKRPIIQEVHTTQQYITGSNATVSQDVSKKEIAKDRRLFTGIYGSKSEIGGIIGWTW